MDGDTLGQDDGSFGGGIGDGVVLGVRGMIVM